MGVIEPTRKKEMNQKTIYGYFEEVDLFLWKHEIVFSIKTLPTDAS